MSKVWTFITVLASLWIGSTQENTIIQGKVTDAMSGEPLIFATVVLYKNGVMVKGHETDLDGYYSFSEVIPGTYDMEASFLGYTSQRLKNIIIQPGRTHTVHLQVSDNKGILDLGVEIKQFKIPLIEINNNITGITTADKIHNLPTKSIDAISATSAGISYGSAVSVRGSRSAETVYLIDGIRVPSSVEESETPKKTNQAGLVTAGEWNDLNNWEKWSELLKQDEFKNMNKHWSLYTNHRYPVFITNEYNIPVAGVSICILDNNDSIIWKTITDIHGRAELFDITDQPASNHTLQYEYEKTTKKLALSRVNKNQGITIKIKADCKSTKKANISFVVDATGSMSDEINFLKSDLSSVIGDIESRNSHVSISYSSVFYRDEGDAYVTTAQDFTTDEQQLSSFIESQNAGGGGDYPEAVDSALLHSLKLGWEDDADVKLIFLILDAPPHMQHIERYKKAITIAASMGIKIIPVTASGIDRATEFLMKFTSILTNSTYTFITKHSGIGSGHLTPVHNDYEVEKLNQLLVRLINGYLYTRPCEDNLITNNEFKIFPNPAKDILNVTLSEGEILDLEVLSMTGQVLMSEKDFGKRKIKLNIQDLISGQYFVRIRYNDKVLVKPFIKVN